VPGAAFCRRGNVRSESWTALGKDACAGHEGPGAPALQPHCAGSCRAPLPAAATNRMPAALRESIALFSNCMSDGYWLAP
jgi:hypothetical protein